MDHYKELLCSKIIEEFPLFMQTAFFVWPSTDAMFDYAHSNPKHAEMFKKKKFNWDSEELFTRFKPRHTEVGSLPEFI